MEREILLLLPCEREPFSTPAEIQACPFLFEKIGFRRAPCRSFHQELRVFPEYLIPSRVHFLFSARSLVQEFRFEFTSNGTVDQVGNFLVGISGQFDIFPYQGRISRKIFYQ